MNETSLMPILFENEEFGSVRWLKVENEPYAVGNDIASVLEYAKPKDAVSAHCHGAVSYGLIDSLGRMQETKIIPIGDIFRLIVAASKQSKNENIREKAKRLESWIFDTVIPAIATTGTYSIQPVQQIMVDPYKMNAEQQFRLEFLREQNRSKELDIKKIELEKSPIKEIVTKNIPEFTISKIAEELQLDFPADENHYVLTGYWLHKFLMSKDLCKRDYILIENGLIHHYDTKLDEKLIRKGVADYQIALRTNQTTKVQHYEYIARYDLHNAKKFFISHKKELYDFLKK